MLNKNLFTKMLCALAIMLIHQSTPLAQSVARKWNTAQLASIRLSFAKPTVHALHLKRMGIAMYDAWAAYDQVAAPYMLGKTHGSFTCPYDGIPAVSSENIEAYRDEAISYAAYTYLKEHYPQQAGSPGNLTIMLYMLDTTMTNLGYDINYYSTDYTSGDPAALGIYIAQQLDAWSFVDGSNEQNEYDNQVYQTENMEMNPNFSGNPGAIFPNLWQSLDLAVCTDQAGNLIPCSGNATIPALTPEWGWVDPFSLDSCQLTYHERAGIDWPVYLDPGAPPYLEDDQYLPENILGPNVNMFKYGFLTTLMWHWFHNNPDAGLIDTSPNNIGNLNIVLNPTEADELGPDDLPTTPEEFVSFYNLFTGQVPDPGYLVNPEDSAPYAEQLVPMGDYSRAIAQYWADGPKSETPPGHWFVILNEVSDSLPEKRWRGEDNPIISDLEWDVKSYFTLGGGVHDAAIACWSAKGAYDYTRPIYAIRTMAEFGQCTYPDSVNYHINGLPLIDGYIELVTQEDIDNPDLTFEQGDLNQVKIKTWLGPYGFAPTDTTWQGTQQDGHGWKLALDWWTYQVASFVTPPFAGYYSGHSTYSRTAAEILTQITGDAYFPGGMFEYVVDTLFADTFHYPSAPVHLQWATYRDAADQCSISRIFGGLHPPQDDIPGRRVGLVIGNQVVDFAERFMLANSPQVLSVEVNEVNPESGDFDFSIAVQFDQAMNTGDNPSVQVTNPEFESTVTLINNYWENDSTFLLEYTVPEGNGSLIGISFEVQGFEPAQWIVAGSCSTDTLNLPLPYVPTPIDIDLKAPLCSAATTEPFITDADTGSEWQIELTFDEEMDTTSFDFANAITNPDFTANMSYQGVNWTSDTSAIVRYTILDNNNEVLLPVNAAFLVGDVAGNVTLGCTVNVSIPIDTQNPVCYIGSPQPDYVVSDSEAETGTFSIDFYFDDDLDTTFIPVITYTADNPTQNTLTQQNITWINDTAFNVLYTVVDSNEELNNIIIEVTNVFDSHLNPMVQSATFAHPFEVDTRNPIIQSIEITENYITASPANFAVNVSYDESMNESISPNISFVDAPQLTLSGNSWLDEVSFQQTVELNLSDFNLYDIDLTIEGNSTDLAGNFSNDSTLLNQLDIQLVGIRNLESARWSMYPNPAESGSPISITSAIGAIEKIEIYDVFGKIVFAAESLQQPSYILTLPYWSAGCYIVRIQTESYSATRPLVISSVR